MLRREWLGAIAAAAALVAPLAVVKGQERVAVPLTDASKPVTLKASTMNGNIHVKGGGGKEVTVEWTTKDGSSSSSRREPKGREGMRRIDLKGGGLNVEEANNVVQVSTSHWSEDGTLLITVPTDASVRLNSVNGDWLRVENIRGDVELNATNGEIFATNVSGSVVANSSNGDIKVTLDQITAGKAMSFVTLNGDVDVTLPPDVKARMKLQSDHGEVWTDFEMQVDTQSRSQVEDNRSKGGRYRVKFDKAVYGTVNGGGPEYRFQTMNGDIVIRKKK